MRCWLTVLWLYAMLAGAGGRRLQECGVANVRLGTRTLTLLASESHCAVAFAMFAGADGQGLQQCGMADGQLVHIARREYVLACNWKVFCDNYLVRSACICLSHV
jgi:hypothetical protein